MRKLNNSEKEILKNIINYNPLYEQGMFLCSKFLNDHYIGENSQLSLFVNCSANNVMISVPQIKQNQDALRRKKVMFIVAFFSLLNQLEKEGKIYLIGEEAGDKTLGPEFQEKVNLTPDLSKQICQSLDKYIYVSDDLIEFVKSDFKDEEKKRHSKTLKWSKIGTGVALILGIIGFFKPTQSPQKVILDKKPVLKLDSNRQKLINKQNKLIKEISLKLDSLRNRSNPLSN